MITFQIKSNVLKKKAEDALVVALDNELMEDEYGEESFLDTPEPKKKGFFSRPLSFFIPNYGAANHLVDLDNQSMDLGNHFKMVRIQEDIRVIRDVISTCEFAPAGSMMTIDSVVAEVLNTYTK